MKGIGIMVSSQFRDNSLNHDKNQDLGMKLGIWIRIRNTDEVLPDPGHIRHPGRHHHRPPCPAC